MIALIGPPDRGARRPSAIPFRLPEVRDARRRAGSRMKSRSTFTRAGGAAMPRPDRAGVELRRTYDECTQLRADPRSLAGPALSRFGRAGSPWRDPRAAAPGVGVGRVTGRVA